MEKVEQFAKLCQERKENKWNSIIQKSMDSQKPVAEINKKQRRNKALRKVKEYFEELLDGNQGDS